MNDYIITPITDLTETVADGGSNRRPNTLEPGASFTLKRKQTDTLSEAQLAERHITRAFDAEWLLEQLIANSKESYGFTTAWATLNSIRTELTSNFGPFNVGDDGELRERITDLFEDLMSRVTSFERDRHLPYS